MRRVVPVLVVDQLDEALAKYSEVLGLEIVMNHGWIATLADPTDRTKQLSLLTHDATAAVNPSVSIEVDDIDAAHRSAVDASVRIVHPLTDEAWGVRRFFFEDIDGNVVNVLAHP